MDLSSRPMFHNNDSVFSADTATGQVSLAIIYLLRTGLSILRPAREKRPSELLNHALGDDRPPSLKLGTLVASLSWWETA